VVTVSLVILSVVACTNKPSSSEGASKPSSSEGASQAAQTGRICGQPILNSPYTYDGAAGTYRTGTAGLPTYGTPGSDFPEDTAGVVLPTGKQGYMSYQLSPDTVYYLLPGEHIGFFQANKNDAFVGGLAGGMHTVLSGNYSGYPWAIDSNFSDGDQPGVTIEYLTIEKFQPNGDAAAINQSTNTKWTLQYDTITLNVPGAGVIAGADNTLKDNCLTLNGQYGFQSSSVGPWGNDSVTGGPYNVTVTHNEISYNDTCDFEGLLSNAAIGWSGYNPVPSRYRNSHCGTVTGDGNQGGFKLWATNGVTIEDNYIHNNWGPGIWADTDNANTTYVGNTITYNDGQAIIEEISYNFSITNNYLAYNGWAVGLGNPGFPTPAIYISESGSDTAFGGVPACRAASCAQQRSYPDRSIISRNTLVDNGGSVLLWQNSDRFCSAEFDKVCTLPSGGRSGQFTLAGCKANLPSASIDPTGYIPKRTGSPSLDWWDGCLWKTANVSVTNNVINFNPMNIAYCNRTQWPACGAGGIFSEYSVAAPYNSPGGWVIASQLTFFQNNNWSDNVYNGPSTFYAWNQGNGDNPVSWAAWTGNTSKGDKCGTPYEHKSGYCSGPFGQDSGSTYQSTPEH
jgi:parallel beta-helix repeat protein